MRSRAARRGADLFGGHQQRPRCRPVRDRRPGRGCRRRSPRTAGGSDPWSDLGVAVNVVQRVRFSPSAAMTTSATSPLMHVVGDRRPRCRWRRPRRRPSERLVVSDGSAVPARPAWCPAAACGTSALPSSSRTTAASASSPPAPPEIFRHHQSGGADLLAQQAPQLLVVAAFGFHRACARPRGRRACPPGRRRFSAAVGVLHSCLEDLQQSTTVQRSDRPRRCATPARAAVTGTGRVPG